MAISGVSKAEDLSGQPREVALRVVQLVTTARTLSDRVAALLDIVSPVMRAPEAKISDRVPSPSVTVLGGAMEDVEVELQGVVDRVNDALDRLEL